MQTLLDYGVGRTTMMTFALKAELSQSNQPNFDYPPMHKYTKIIINVSFLHSYLNEPLQSEQGKIIITKLN